ncbi:MAG: hypothetical protein KAS93_04875 [Gammaproteobacteria bacterium]|nr:hypothetical protein [Gammaproteobacteria bacterium]
MGLPGVYDKEQHLSFLRQVVADADVLSLQDLLDIDSGSGEDAKIVKHKLGRKENYGINYKSVTEGVALSSVLCNGMDYTELALNYPQFRKAEYLYCDVEWQLRRLLVKIDAFIGKQGFVEQDLHDVISEPDFLFMAMHHHYEKFYGWVDGLRNRNASGQKVAVYSPRLFCGTVDSAVKPRNDDSECSRNDVGGQSQNDDERQTLIHDRDYYIRMCSLFYSIKNRLLYPSEPSENRFEGSALSSHNYGHHDDCYAMLRALPVLRELLSADISMWGEITAPLRETLYVEGVLHRASIPVEISKFIAAFALEGIGSCDNGADGQRFSPSGI